MANSPSVLTHLDSTSTIFDQDVLSDTTGSSGTFISRSHLESKEYVVRFVFCPSCRQNPDDATSDFTLGHRTLLMLFNRLFPNSLTIYDNNNNKYRSSVPHSNLEHSFQFNITYTPPKPYKQKGPLYTILHRIYSTIPLSEIQSHPAVHNALQQLHLRMNRHHWCEDDVHITNIGFLVGVDPHNHLPDATIESVRVDLTSKLHCTQQTIPHFKLVRSSPYYIDNSGHRTRTRSYDIQVRNKDAKRLIVLLQQAYQDNTVVIFHSLRHHNPESYLGAIRRQEEFIYNSRFVPLYGVSSIMMLSFKRHILDISGVTAVIPHKHTSTKGRWSVLTDKIHFGQVTTTLKQLISSYIPSDSEIECYDYSDKPTFYFPNSSDRLSATAHDNNISFEPSSSSSTVTFSEPKLLQEKEKLLQELAILRSVFYTIQENKFSLPHPNDLPQVLPLILNKVLHQLFTYAVLKT